MTYQETLAYLYNSAPLFQHVGKAAYKEGLENTLALDEYFGHPHKKFRSIHVAGTNGKGSCSPSGWYCSGKTSESNGVMPSNSPFSAAFSVSPQ